MGTDLSHTERLLYARQKTFQVAMMLDSDTGIAVFWVGIGMESESTI